MNNNLKTRFPAARIRRIIQSNDDVGNMAMDVPLLISKALELFLQGLCDHTHKITLERGAHTVGSSHLKKCVQSFNVYDFLREIVGSVPDLVASSVAIDGPIIKRRKLADDENGDGGEKPRHIMHGMLGHTDGSGPGQGRGRGRGRGHGQHNPSSKVYQDEMVAAGLEYKRDGNTKTMSRNFDLLDKDENGNIKTTSLSALNPINTSTKAVPKAKEDKYLGCSSDEIRNLMINPIRVDKVYKSEDSIAAAVSVNTKTKSRSFDLLGTDENGNTETTPASALNPIKTSMNAFIKAKEEKYLGCSLDEIRDLMINPIGMGKLNRKQ